jgi:hypothetical protein
MLILPCMNWLNYGLDFETGRFWKTVLRGIQAWRYCVEIYAIDCIRLKSTQRVLGLWSPYNNPEILREIITCRLDSYPAWSRYKTNELLMLELENAVRRELSRIADQYEKVVSFVNIKAYYRCLRRVGREFDIVTLPREVDWKAARAVPCRNLNELAEILNRLADSELAKVIGPQECHKHSGPASR